ncbi:MAG: hypothetical protein JNL65_00890 [Saprospiraceae bacterium]|nr:hypothetical protein [Saprospiraceae bacterium]
MNQNKFVFILSIFLLALGSLLIPFWFVAFFLALACCWFFDISAGFKLIAHFIIYCGVSIAYCIYAMMQGSIALVHMISGVFQNVSPAILVILSGLLFGLTALLGAWTGHSLKALSRYLKTN